MAFERVDVEEQKEGQIHGHGHGVHQTHCGAFGLVQHDCVNSHFLPQGAQPSSRFRISSFDTGKKSLSTTFVNRRANITNSKRCDVYVPSVLARL